MNSFPDTLRNALLAGLTIAIGGWVFLAVEGGVTGALLFSVGLLTISVLQFALYTGKICYLTKDLTPKGILRLLVIYLGNAAAASFTGLLAVVSKPDIAAYADTMTTAKLSRSVPGAFIASCFCGFLIFAAVEGWRRTKNAAGVCIIVLCVSAFILIGAEHCIADYFYFAAAGKLAEALPFLLLVSLGNSLGGIGGFLLGPGKNE